MELFNNAKIVYGVGDYCTAETCPHMTANSNKGDSRETFFYWVEHGEKAAQDLSAVDYIQKLFDYVTRTIEDETIFPIDGDFPRDFLKTVKIILKRLFRVYAHIYYKHLDAFREMGAEDYLHTSFKHFYFFVTEFDLVKDSAMASMASLIDEIEATRL
eukprot:TRINITY_DN1819_c0_g1_i1.p1 TRINITY_DN1819_c0_g1~~TRINITY_DN1819_c0_g1_i1.p1  ORF type:complete len:158 (-),score=35.30 TRINITY_DN1819_c0_g1_i1:36-509(-)